MSDHGLALRHDPGFGRPVAWDIDLLSGYDHEFLQEAVIGPDQSSFWWLRLRAGLGKRLSSEGAGILWVQGWQVAAYWQAVWQAKSAGLSVWMRGDTNLASSRGGAGKLVRAAALRTLFKGVNKFLYVGEANRKFYRHYGICDDNLHFTPHCVDNNRFAKEAIILKRERDSIREHWGVPTNAFCVLFVGKFVDIKRPLDIIGACQLLRDRNLGAPIHLLFVGSGELEERIRTECEAIGVSSSAGQPNSVGGDEVALGASVAGFLNQNEITQAYVAADCLVLPSESETWGLVVNEAMASGLPCLVSDAVGCSADLVKPLRPDLCFPPGDQAALADALASCIVGPPSEAELRGVIDRYDVLRTVESIEALYLSTTGRDTLRV